MYATVQSFEGQKVSKGRVILARAPGLEVEPAMVHDVIAGDIFFARTTKGYEFTCTPEGFESKRTAVDIEHLPAGAWAWPPRA